MAAVRSLFAFWAGGGGAEPAEVQAGYSSLLALWAGGGAQAEAPPAQAGYGSLMALWLGGASSGDSPVAPPPAAGGGGRIKLKPRRPVVIDVPLPLMFDEQVREDEEALLLAGVL